jgi:transcriptional regulator with XRE-family HTH domain
MEFTTNLEPKSAREIGYYATRYRHRFHANLLAFIVSQMKARNLTNKQIADRVGKDAAQLSRILSKPSNLTLDTISEILLGVDAEPEPPQFVCFADIANRQYAHPLIARGLGEQPGQTDIAASPHAIKIETRIPVTASTTSDFNRSLFKRNPESHVDL